MREKCTVAGCEIPARGEPLKNSLIGNGFTVCGEHRKPLAEMLGSIQHQYVIKERRLRVKAVQQIIDGLHEMGDHDDELALAYGGEAAP